MRHSIFSFLFLLISPSLASAGDWPQFLGPDGRARSSESVPKSWSDSENLKWKVDLPGTGSSSPIVIGDRIIVTCYVSEPDPKRQVLCFDKSSGQHLWSVDFPIDYREDGYQGYITEHGYASNTPVSDGKDVFVFLGKGGVHSISLDGEKKWSVDIGKESSNRQWGSAASLLLFGDTVIVNAAEESRAIITLNKATGEEVWRQEANMLELTYGTPRIVSLADGEHELVISVPSEIWSLNPMTGKLKWYASSPMTGNVSPSVIVDEETVYSFGGYRASGSIAIRAGGKDDVSDSHVRWTNRSSSYVATPLLHDGRFYWIDDRGIAYSTLADDGEVIYRERVTNLESGRPVYASPVLIGDKIYVVTRRSGTLVYEPGDAFQPIAQNKFANDETDFNASPAVSDGRLYLRSNQSLYCVAQ
ncbi:outer membrane protein assembly factor BamB family protein [Neorhodopirellula pilleata]|uniref:Outer membrane biogenesis protein BamB n=1 Tax=Neorhodopirellula pilleata TaxID=2714738 RepID=A0A5C6AVB7_9BACT|nr:PQQ-binding-like beta-propeller repeat protein [Neorhodopirellula pilleata]TWU03427.1 outer membrane biogenesis protein BamB [Neorhodopirellula pilleata]